MKRVDGLFVFEVNGANPNGSPDDDNNPRMLQSGRGWVSSVSIKRKVRNIFSDHKSPVFKELGLDTDRFNVLESWERGYQDVTPIEAAKKAIQLANSDEGKFLNRYVDVRLFGTTMLSGKDKTKKTDIGEIKLVKTGPLTVSNAFSICPINVATSTISKMAPYRPEHLETQQNDLAPDGAKFVEHGLYVGQFGFNPHIARHTNTTNEDLDAFKKVLPYIFEFSASAARPVGSIRFVKIWWAEHENSLGSFNAYDLFRKLTPTPGTLTPSKIEDYEIPDGTDIKGGNLINLLD